MESGDIRVFLHVARAGQMASVSRSLGLDHSTISRRIARLEEQVGVPLFDRAGRRLSLTEEGARLLAAAEKLESIIIRDVISLGESRQEIAGRVRIGTSEGFGAHYLAKRLPAMVADFPELEVELVALPRNFSLGMREADLAITMDRPDAGDIRFKKLTSCTLGIYAAPPYFKDRSRPSSIADLSDQPWCGYIMELLFTSELDLLKFGPQVITPRYRTTSVSAQIEAVAGGSVIAVLPCYMASQRGGLERLLPDEVSIERSYWISVHGDLVDSPRVRTLMQQIEQQVHRDRSLFLPGAARECEEVRLTTLAPA
jgi:DNA-binding transcriptional LysR family regulator